MSQALHLVYIHQITTLSLSLLPITPQKQYSDRLLKKLSWQRSLSFDTDNPGKNVTLNFVWTGQGSSFFTFYNKVLFDYLQRDYSSINYRKDKTFVFTLQSAMHFGDYMISGY